MRIRPSSLPQAPSLRCCMYSLLRVRHSQGKSDASQNEETCLKMMSLQINEGLAGSFDCLADFGAPGLTLQAFLHHFGDRNVLFYLFIF